MKSILILCTGNSCRSQMADGWLTHMLSSKDFNIYSAGTHPEKVNPHAISVMQDFDVDISKNTSNDVNEYKDIKFDYVITVCDNAQELCPVFPNSNIIHKSFPDPAKAEGSDDELYKVYKDVALDLRQYLSTLFKKYL